MSFLTIPNQEGLFTTIKAGKSADEEESRCPGLDADDEDDDEDDTEDIRLIPRCSPVPRKRGASIFDETAEYMRIHLALSATKRVAFADTTGGDLVDVKEFVAFESDDEEASARWEEEEAKYRKPEREPTYNVHPEFKTLSGGALLQAVHSNKVEVEHVSSVENEPLAFCGVIRVLNVSFHKAVYIRSTMDNWATYFDHPAEYVQGSHDGATDKFSFKLSFAPPYITHGSRTEFVVRYETSDGDYWANNSSINYVVTLHLSYEDDSPQTKIDISDLRGILKPPKPYSMDLDLGSEDEQDREKAEEAGTSQSGLVRPTAICPLLTKPEIDIELIITGLVVYIVHSSLKLQQQLSTDSSKRKIAVHPSGPSVPPNQELPSVDGTQSTHTVSAQFPSMSSSAPVQTNLSFILCTNESVQSNKSQPLPGLRCVLGNQTSEQPKDSSPFALLPATTPSMSQESRLRSGSSQAGEEGISPLETSCEHRPTTETNQWPTGEYGSTHSPAGRPCHELPAECVSALTVTQSSEPEVAVGLSELVAGLSEGSTRSAAHYEGSAPALLSPVAESQGAEGEAPPSLEPAENDSVSTGVTEVNENLARHSASSWAERQDAPQISPDTLLENLPNTMSEAAQLQSEYDVNRNLMPSIIFLTGVVSLSIVLQEPTALFIIGLFFVLHRL